MDVATGVPNVSIETHEFTAKVLDLCAVGVEQVVYAYERKKVADNDESFFSIEEWTRQHLKRSAGLIEPVAPSFDSERLNIGKGFTKRKGRPRKVDQVAGILID